MSNLNNCYIEKWLYEVHVNESAVINYAEKFKRKLNKAWETLESILLLKALTLIDLTTLAGDDTPSNVTALVNKGLHPLPVVFIRQIIESSIKLLERIRSVEIQMIYSSNIPYERTDDQKYTGKNNTTILNGALDEFSLEHAIEVKQLLRLLNLEDDNQLKALEQFLLLQTKRTVRVAAICVYPKWVKTVQDSLKSRRFSSLIDQNNDNECKISTMFPVAAVAAGFPSGQYDIESKTHEVAFALHCGASEIDVVISRNLVIGHKWYELFKEIRSLKETCGNAKMKTILGVGECGSLENVYKASMVAMMAGSDYIKTSTGKEAVNATLPVGVVMCRAIRNYYIRTGKKVGFKPAGGIKTADDTLKWMKLVIIELGPEWLSFFRIGASGVIDDIKQRLKQLNT